MWWAVGDLIDLTWNFTVEYPGRWFLGLAAKFIRADGPPGVTFKTRRMMDRPWWGP